ncbi:hypothetical protein [Sphingomonas sp. LHG3406-1]|uniref:hypothetical protein n=1 Tax=Sphingomonas sp. LHG3406-1 TaxID=2804617 RepID=UPI00263761D5|nr:hypothetical protein [Sphingomonas sp. LHG3406-1]
MAKNDAYQNDFDTQDNAGSGIGQRFSGLGDSATSTIDNSPLIALGAGLALGAVLGAVLPASQKEKELLGPLGKKLNDAGTGAIDRGRGMAKQKFDEMAGDKVREFLGSSSSSSSTGSSAGA